jgi:hypothetical protein
VASRGVVARAAFGPDAPHFPVANTKNVLFLFSLVAKTLIRSKTMNQEAEL